MAAKACLLLFCCVVFVFAGTDWKAQWIWLPEQETSGMMLARKTFDLHHVPEEVALSITATSRYELYVNGESVARGPVRCAPHHQSFDVHSISRYLQAGKDVLAVRVHFQQGTVSFYESARGGLLAQLNGLDVQTEVVDRIRKAMLEAHEPSPFWDKNNKPLYNAKAACELNGVPFVPRQPNKKKVK